MSASGQARPTIAQSGEGKHMAGPGSSVMLGGEQTGGTLAVVLGSVPPGSGPPFHVHGRDDELFLVIEGTISYFCNGDWTDVRAGGAVYFPQGTPHLFRNRGTTPARHWILTTPAGFEHFLPRFNDEMTRPGGPDRERIVALHAEYGYTLLDGAQHDAGGERDGVSVVDTGTEEVRMTASSQARPTIVQPDAGKPLDFGGGQGPSVMLGGEQTGGTLTVIMQPVAPGENPPPHIHAHEDELFLVVEGPIGYLVDGHWTDVGPGGVVYIPRGSTFSYRNGGTTPARHWVLTTPAGIEHYFARLATELTRVGGPDMGRIAAMSREFGTTYPEVGQG